ncbi:MAG: DNA polymerase [Myxococcaceae bacterium]
MAERTIIASATNLLARGFQVVPTDRKSKSGQVVNGLFAVARALHRVLAMKAPARAIAVIDSKASTRGWPELLFKQVALLPELCRALGFHVVETDEELNVCASYAKAALDAGDDVIIAAVDKRYAQLVGERVWWFDANKDVRYTIEIVQKRFNVPPAQVGQWLALVGDEDLVPGLKGIGAKGATEFLTEHGTVEAAMAKLDTLDGRVAKALKAARAEVPAALDFAKLKTDRALPLALGKASWNAPDAAKLNALYEGLGFNEFLVADASGRKVECCETAEQVAAVLGKAKGVTTLHAVLEDPDPVQSALVGVGLALENGELFYVPAGGRAWPPLVKWLEDPKAKKQGHDLVPAFVALERLGHRLAGVVSDSACVSHLTQPSNWAPHDLTVVAKHALGRAIPDDDEVLGVGRARKKWAQLSIDRAGEIAGQRAEVSLELIKKLGGGVEPKLLTEYLDLSQVLVRMELAGLRVDVSELEKAKASFATIEATLEKEITALAGHAFNINSSKQLGEVLFAELKLPVVSHTRTGWSTANEALERIEHAHPIVALVLRWRTLRRLRDNWLNALEKCIDADGRVHSRFHLARSFSGHLINTNPDLGRVPGRTDEMNRVRRAFVAEPGWSLMSVDFSQLGLYVLAHLTKDPNLVEPLKRRADMHRLTASAVLEIPADQLTLEQRQVGKVVNFATFAGQGASSLGMQLGITPAESKEYIARFDRHYAKVRAFQDEQLRLAKERGYIVTIAGRKWPIGGLESLDSMLLSYAERLARRATHEGSVSDVGRRALLDADRALRAAGLKARPVVQILDEVLFEVPDEEIPRAAKIASEAMRNAFVLEVPLVVGVEVGKNWADLTPLKLE